MATAPTRAAPSAGLGPTAAALSLLVLLSGLVVLPGYAGALPDPRPWADGAGAGWLRAAHHWAATAVVALGLAWLALAWARMDAWTGDPRRWTAAVAIVAALSAAFLTGRILPWDQHAWESYGHLRSGLGPAGPLVGGADPEGARLASVLVLHVGLAAVSVALLLWAFRGPVADVWTSVRRRAGRLGAGALWPGGALLAVVGLASFAPPALGPAPIVDLQVSHPDWPFLWLAPLETVWGVWALRLAPAAVLVFAWAAPRFPPHSTRQRAVALVLVVLLWGVASWRGLAA